MSEPAPPSYPHPAPRAQTAQPADTYAILSFALGLVSFMACQVFGPLSLLFGWMSYKRSQAEGRPLDPLAIVGLVLGIVSTMLLVVLLVVFGGLCLFYVLFFLVYMVLAIFMLVVGGV